MAMLPGVDFGRPDTELTARLAYVNFDGNLALKASMALGTGHDIDERFLEQCCPEPLEAVQRLCAWLGRC